MWLGILTGIIAGCIVMSVVDSVFFGNGLYSVVWISVPYLLAAILLFCCGVMFVYRHGLWSDNTGKGSSSEFLTILTACSPFLYTDSLAKGLSLSIKPQIFSFAGAGMIIVWSMAIVVFVSPAYAGIIVLVITQVLYLWYLLDLRWSSNYRLLRVCQTLHETSGDLAVSLIEQMEADDENREFEPAALTVLRSLRGGLWNVFQEAIAESVSVFTEKVESEENESKQTVGREAWEAFLSFAISSLSGEKDFRKTSNSVRKKLVSRVRHGLLKFVTFGRCGGSPPRLPSDEDLQNVARLDEEASIANEQWMTLIAMVERSLVNKGRLADTLISVDWKGFLRWCVETPYTTLRKEAADDIIATLQDIWSRATGNVIPGPPTSGDEEDAENPVVSASPLEVSLEGAERREALISDIFSKTEDGKRNA